jgi:hypothetical protein
MANVVLLLTCPWPCAHAIMLIQEHVFFLERMIDQWFCNFTADD